MDKGHTEDAPGDTADRHVRQIRQLRPLFTRQAGSDGVSDPTTGLSLSKKHAGGNNREHELQDSKTHSRDGRQEPAREGPELRPDFAQRLLEVHRGQPPEPFQRLADDGPLANALWRHRNGDGSVAQIGGQFLRAGNEGFREQDGWSDQEHERQKREDRCGELAASAERDLKPVVDGIGRDGDDNAPDDRYQKGPDDLQAPGDEHDEHANPNGRLDDSAEEDRIGCW